MGSCAMTTQSETENTAHSFRARLLAVSREFEYTVYVGEGLVSTAGDILAAQLTSGVVLITDTTVEHLYAPRVVESLGRASIPVSIVTIPPGEEHKTMGTALRLLDDLDRVGAKRRTVLVAVGGGAVCD